MLSHFPHCIRGGNSGVGGKVSKKCHNLIHFCELVLDKYPGYMKRDSRVVTAMEVGSESNKRRYQ